MSLLNGEVLYNFYGKAKMAAIRAAAKINGGKSELTMDFNKEAGMWYADVKGWPGPKGMLLMVDGADTFLEHLSSNGENVTLDLNLNEKENYGILNYAYPHPAGDGAYYTTKMNGREHTLWLCGVTEFVFGEMPDKIWFKK